MFGVVPKPLWERRAPADDRNRIQLGLRPLLVRGERTLHHRRRHRRQDGREEASRSTASIARRDLDRPRSPRPGSARTTSTSCSRRTCTSITPAASPSRDGTAASCPRSRARATSSAAAEWEDADASARAQSRELSGGQLRAAGAGRRPRLPSTTTAIVMPGVACRAHRRPHDAPPDRDRSSPGAARRCSRPT